MRDGRAPRGFAAASIKTPGLQGGTEERFAGYGVMGLPFRSRHYLALRNFPASSIGPGYRAVWHRDPHRRWTFYADAPAEVSCARYFGATSAGGAERVPIDVTWTGPRSLRVTVPDVLAWEVHLAATAATRLLSSASRLLPDPCWDSDRVLGAMGRVAGLLLRAGRVRLQGTVPNGQHFQAAHGCSGRSPTAPRWLAVTTSVRRARCRTRTASATSGCRSAACSPSGQCASTPTTQPATTPPRTT